VDLNLDLDTLKQLIKLMSDNGLNELELEEEGKRVHLRKGDDARHPPVMMAAAPAVVHAPLAAAAHAPAPAAPAAAGAKAPLPAGVKEIKSPMVGTFYGAPSPDAAPFVAAGDRIQEDTVLCIIEAMKVMNEIKAECKGEIVKILVANGEAVEYGEPLFHVKLG
jgi:acetyl-CoA carboxylase biotin carboxyl carrier protein